MKYQSTAENDEENLASTCTDAREGKHIFLVYPLFASLRKRHIEIRDASKIFTLIRI